MRTWWCRCLVHSGYGLMPDARQETSLHSAQNIETVATFDLIADPEFCGRWYIFVTCVTRHALGGRDRHAASMMTTWWHREKQGIWKGSTTASVLFLCLACVVLCVVCSQACLLACWIMCCSCAVGAPHVRCRCVRCLHCCATMCC